MPDIYTDSAIAESASFLEYFDALPDPRQQSKVIYPLDEVLLLCLLASLAGAETFVDIALFGSKRSTCCVASSLLFMGHPHMTIWVTYSRPWIQTFSNVVLYLGLPNSARSQKKLLLSMVRQPEARKRMEKHMALNILRRPDSKLSLRTRRKAAAWDDEFLVELLKT